MVQGRWWWWGGGDAHLRGTVALADDLDFPTLLRRQPGRALAAFALVLARRGGLRPRRALPQPVVAALPAARIAAVRQAGAGAATPAPLFAPAVFGCELCVQIEAEGAEGGDVGAVPVAREEAGAVAGGGGEEAWGRFDEVD